MKETWHSMLLSKLVSNDRKWLKINRKDFFYLFQHRILLEVSHGALGSVTIPCILEWTCMVYVIMYSAVQHAAFYIWHTSEAVQWKTESLNIWIILTSGKAYLLHAWRYCQASWTSWYSSEMMFGYQLTVNVYQTPSWFFGCKQRWY